MYRLTWTSTLGFCFNSGKAGRNHTIFQRYLPITIPPYSPSRKLRRVQDKKSTSHKVRKSPMKTKPNLPFSQSKNAYTVVHSTTNTYGKNQQNPAKPSKPIIFEERKLKKAAGV